MRRSVGDEFEFAVTGFGEECVWRLRVLGGALGGIGKVTGVRKKMRMKEGTMRDYRRRW